MRKGVEEPYRADFSLQKACSAAEDFVADYAFGGVSCVDNQLGLVDYLLVVVGGVVGDYNYCVITS